jgi:hypothetical protein
LKSKTTIKSEKTEEVLKRGDATIVRSADVKKQIVNQNNKL